VLFAGDDFALPVYVVNNGVVMDHAMAASGYHRWVDGLESAAKSPLALYLPYQYRPCIENSLLVAPQ